MYRSKIKQNARSAFSLIELLVVIAIIGILAALAVPSYSQYILRVRLHPILSELSVMVNNSILHAQTNGMFGDPYSQGWATYGVGSEEPGYGYVYGKSMVGISPYLTDAGNGAGYPGGNLYWSLGFGDIGNSNFGGTRCGQYGMLQFIIDGYNSSAGLAVLQEMGFGSDVNKFYVQIEYWHYQGVVYTMPTYYVMNISTGRMNSNALIPGWTNQATWNGQWPTSWHQATCQEFNLGIYTAL